MDARADRPAGEGDHAHRARRDAPSRRRSRGAADPAGGRDRGGGQDRQDLRRRPGTGLRERHPRGGPPRNPAESAAVSAGAPDSLDDLIGRLERAAEQLRSGELSPDAAATLVEDCASLATQAAAELEQLTRAEVSAPAPGQDTLL